MLNFSAQDRQLVFITWSFQKKVENELKGYVFHQLLCMNLSGYQLFSPKAIWSYHGM